MKTGPWLFHQDRSRQRIYATASLHSSRIARGGTRFSALMEKETGKSLKAFGVWFALIALFVHMNASLYPRLSGRKMIRVSDACAQRPAEPQWIRA